MERPQPELQTGARSITAEIVYLDEMRRQNQVPEAFMELGNAAIRLYEARATTYPDGERPAIMDEYEQHDTKPSEAVASCTALANALLTLKETGSSLTFVDIAVMTKSETVLTKLKALAAGSILAGDDEQLAIPSDGKYYPVLDMRKQTAVLAGVGLRVWGWDYTKCIFTYQEGKQHTYPANPLIYPSDEKTSTRQIELAFVYHNAESGNFTESISLHIASDEQATISKNIWASAYAETGYEGHNGSALQEFTDDDIAAFGDLIAEIVGDEPESVLMKQHKRLQRLADAAATPSARQAVLDLVAATWPAQAQYLLSTKQEGENTPLALQLCDETTAHQAIDAVNAMIEKWKT